MFVCCRKAGKSQLYEFHPAAFALPGDPWEEGDVPLPWSDHHDLGEKPSTSCEVKYLKLVPDTWSASSLQQESRSATLGEQVRRGWGRWRWGALQRFQALKRLERNRGRLQGVIVGNLRVGGVRVDNLGVYGESWRVPSSGGCAWRRQGTPYAQNSVTWVHSASGTSCRIQVQSYWIVCGPLRLVFDHWSVTFASRTEGAAGWMVKCLDIIGLLDMFTY